MFVFFLISDFCKNRTKRKTEGELVAKNVLSNLSGEWRLIFTTGTIDTQKRIKGKISYFPIKVWEGVISLIF